MGADERCVLEEEAPRVANGRRRRGEQVPDEFEGKSWTSLYDEQLTHALTRVQLGGSRSSSPCGRGRRLLGRRRRATSARDTATRGAARRRRVAAPPASASVDGIAALALRGLLARGRRRLDERARGRGRPPRRREPSSSRSRRARRPSRGFGRARCFATTTRAARRSRATAPPCAQGRGTRACARRARAARRRPRRSRARRRAATPARHASALDHTWTIESAARKVDLTRTFSAKSRRASSATSIGARGASARAASAGLGIFCGDAARRVIRLRASGSATRCGCAPGEHARGPAVLASASALAASPTGPPTTAAWPSTRSAGARAARAPSFVFGDGSGVDAPARLGEACAWRIAPPARARGPASSSTTTPAGPPRARDRARARAARPARRRLAQRDRGLRATRARAARRAGAAAADDATDDDAGCARGAVLFHERALRRREPARHARALLDIDYATAATRPTASAEIGTGFWGHHFVALRARGRRARGRDRRRHRRRR